MLLSQRHHVTAVDIDAARVERLSRRQAPIQDADIEAYLSGCELDLTATLDAAEAYRQADWVVISTPTNYDPHLNYFDTSSVESVIEEVLAVNPRAYMAVKSTVPVGFTQRMLEKHPGARLVFSPEFLREGPCPQRQPPSQPHHRGRAGGAGAVACGRSLCGAA